MKERRTKKKRKGMESATGEGKKVRKKKRETSRDERRGVRERKSGRNGKRKDPG